MEKTTSNEEQIARKMKEVEELEREMQEEREKSGCKVHRAVNPERQYSR